MNKGFSLNFLEVQSLQQTSEKKVSFYNSWNVVANINQGRGGHDSYCWRKLKLCMRLFAFHFMLITLENAWIPLFSILDTTLNCIQFWSSGEYRVTTSLFLLSDSLRPGVIVPVWVKEICLQIICITRNIWNHITVYKPIIIIN